MQTIVSHFNWRKPAHLDEALELLAQTPELRPFAGGTDVMVELEAGMVASATFLDINDLEDLRYIEEEADHIRIGALTTYKDLMVHSIIKKELPLLVRAAEETAAPAIQTRGTLGGNVANASPAADTPPVLLAYDAKVVLQSIRGTRELDYNRFHLAYKKMDMAKDELIVAVKIPKLRRTSGEWYHKVGTRRMQAISKVVFAGVSHTDKGRFEHLRLAFGSVAATPIRAIYAENYVLGKSLAEIDKSCLAEELFKTVTPLDDVRSTREYREMIALNLVETFLNDTSKT